MNIYIFGASGSGTSTLGRALGERSFRWLDTDDFYWFPTDPPYTDPRPRDERIALLRPELERGGCALSGTLGASLWGEPLLGLFDLAVFVYTPWELREERLRAREREHFGDRILPGGDMYENHVEFIEWASRYDTAPAWSQRSRATDEVVMRDYIKCPILRLDGAASVAENADLVIKTLETMEKSE